MQFPSTPIVRPTERDGAHIVYDLDPDLCREHGIVTQDAAVYLPGTVMKSDGAGKLVRYDGTGDVYGILFAGVDATAADVRGVVSVRLTVVNIDLLAWDGALSAAQQTAALEAMKASHLVGRPAY